MRWEVWVGGTHLLWEKVFKSPTGNMLAQPEQLESSVYGSEDDSFEGVFGMSAELTRVRVMRVRHR